MNMEIYSYKSHKAQELFGDHIRVALELINENSWLIRYAKKIDANIYEKTKLAIIFHDIGKIFYQNNYGPRGLSFIGHEILSAVIFNKIVKNIKTDYDTITFAILYHHHAMPIEKRIQKILYIKEPKNLDKILTTTCKIFQTILEKNGLQALVKPLENVLNNIKNQAKNGFKQFLLCVKTEAKSLKTHIKEKYFRNRAFRKIALILLQILVVTDYITARKNRKDTLDTTFSRAIQDFYTLYLKKKKTN